MSWKGLSLSLLTCCTCVAAAPAAHPTFYKDIAPIIYGNCSTCHRPGEAGPFPLLNYADVKRHASQIALVTEKRFMPPWLPDVGHGEFQEERRLSAKQISLIQDWVKGGAPAGRIADAPPSPHFTSEWALGTPDLVLHVAQPYHLGPTGPEIFWNFVIPVPVTTTHWVRAMEVRPGNARVFHHANVIIDRSGSTLRNEPQPGAGFPGMDLTVEENTFDPDGHFLSWKPGSPAVVEPDGLAWRADPGMNLVLNVHLKRSGKEEVVDPVIGLYFTDKPQTKFPLLVQLEHDGSLDIPANAKDFVVTDQLTCPIDLQVLAVYPHAHYLATLMEAYATLPDGSKKWLIRIPHWDLNWQGVFRLKDPLTLPKGTLLTMTYHYDNSAQNPLNPNQPPQRVVAGNQANNEMSHFWLQVLPVGNGDQRAVLQEAVMRHRLDKYPGDFSANFNLGDLMMEKHDPGAAVQYFHAAAVADPKSAIAAGELGSAMFETANIPGAEAQFKRALQLDPRYIDARYNLASVEASSQQWAQSTSDFRKVLESNPDHQNAKLRLGEVYFLWGVQQEKAGHYEEAVQRYRESLDFRSDDPNLHGHLAGALARLGRYAEAKTELQALLRIEPNSPEAKQALAQVEARQRLSSK